MPFIDYTPTPNKLDDLSCADGTEGLSAATTNVSLEQLADGIAYVQDRGYVTSSLWKRDEDDGGITAWVFSSTSYAANSTTPTDWQLTIAGVRVSDVLEIDAAFCLRTPANTTGTIRIGVKHGAGVEYMAPGTRAQGGTSTDSVDHVMSIHSRVVATGTGSTVIRLLGKYSGSGGSVSLIAYGELRVKLLRPM